MTEFFMIEGRRGQPKELRVIKINCQFDNCDFIATDEASYFIHLQEVHEGKIPIFDLWSAQGYENQFFQITKKSTTDNINGDAL